MTKIVCTDTYGNSYVFDENEYIERPAVYGVLIENNNILLVKDVWGKKWGLPGGGIDNNESEAEALVREFKEETGLEISTILEKLFSDQSYFLGENEKHPWKTIRAIYKVTAAQGTLQKDGNKRDVLEAKYFSFEAVETIELQANTWNILEKIIAR